MIVPGSVADPRVPSGRAVVRMPGEGAGCEFRYDSLPMMKAVPAG